MSDILKIWDEATQTWITVPAIQGPQGAQGPAGPGVPAGGTDGQFLVKDGATDYSTKWGTLKSLILDLTHPVGSYYWSSDSTDPGTLFGGTWAQVKDKFILALGDTYTTAGATGGEATHTLIKAELPNESYYIKYSGNYIDYGGNKAGSSGGGFSLNSGSASAYTFKTEPIGSGDAHNNMPPYEVAYCWKRTA